MNDASSIVEQAMYRPLYKVGAAAALSMLALIPVQMFIFLRHPPPSDVDGFFALFQRNAWLGLLSLDLLYIVDIILAALVSFALCVALRRTSPTLTSIALLLCLLSTAIYFASNTSLEMQALAEKHAAATTDARRTVLMAAGEAMLSLYQGTAFTVSYVLSAVSGLLIAVVMLRSDSFGRGTAAIGLFMNALGLLPPTIGTIGMVASIAFLVPFCIWLVLIARKLLELGRVSVMEPARWPT